MPLNPQDYRTVEIGPLGGLLDTRSNPHDVAPNSYRWVENFTVQSKNKPCRRPGFEKLLSETTPYNNEDLHDQGTGDPADGQPITLLYEAISTTNVHRLIAATQNRIYANNSGGNWLTIDDTLGGEPVSSCSDVFWQCAQVEDIIVFTNGQDPIQYWTFDGPAGLATIPDLQTTLKITRAGVVGAWKGLILLGDVVADGVRVSHRLVWSDFRKPLSYVPNANISVAGTHDLGYGETILGMMPLADSLLIYTSRSIWEVQLTGTDDIFSFRQRYTEPASGTGCLAYRRTLISTGQEHLYLGRDGIYVYNMYSPKPIRVEWIYNASGAMFAELEDSLCGLHCAGYDPIKREAWFSYAVRGDTSRCPSKTFILNTEYQFSDYMLRGFSAFSNYSPTSASNLRDWLKGNCMCTEAEILAADIDPTLGGYCVTPAAVVCGGSPADSIYKNTPADYHGYSVEDTSGSPGANSLCSILGGLTLEQLCAEVVQAQACSASQRFVMALSSDQSLKQYGGIYAHELVTGHEACGTYTQVGYDSILRSGPLGFNAPNASKLVRRFLVNYDADVQTIPTDLVARLGFARQPSDPNLTTCPILWKVLPAKPLQCGSTTSEADHYAAGTRPYGSAQWPMFWGSQFIYWEIKISGTGGAACFSSINMDIAAKPTRF